MVAPGTVLIIDFKSDAELTLRPEMVKPAYLTQLGLYALAAHQLFQGSGSKPQFCGRKLVFAAKIARRRFGGSGARVHHPVTFVEVTLDST